jgi:hypothetical protein
MASASSLRLEPQHAEQDCARAAVAHDMDAGRAPAQRIVDQAAIAATVPEPAKAVREPPVLERIGRRPVPRLDVGNDLDAQRRAGRRVSSDAE